FSMICSSTTSPFIPIWKINWSGLSTFSSTLGDYFGSIQNRFYASQTLEMMSSQYVKDWLPQPTPYLFDKV
ncbi:hypothetical protein, partial [Vibrio parahaemolyticus]|uniref:hypothetical protein n=3 Tax=Vibrio parahaemolyticus TaxID=670 RepID=UPI001E3F671F